jgi:hypothetical protein
VKEYFLRVWPKHTKQLLWQEMFQNASEQALMPAPKLQLLVFLQFSHLHQTFLKISPQTLPCN